MKPKAHVNANKNLLNLWLHTIQEKLKKKIKTTEAMKQLRIWMKCVEYGWPIIYSSRSIYNCPKYQFQNFLTRVPTQTAEKRYIAQNKNTAHLLPNSQEPSIHPSRSSMTSIDGRFSIGPTISWEDRILVDIMWWRPWIWWGPLIFITFPFFFI